MRLCGYTRVSTEVQGQSGLGAEAQREQIQSWANSHGHELTIIHNDVISSREADRPGFELSRELCRNGQVDGIVVAKLDRLSRSVVEAATILDEFKSQGWSLIALDVGVDTSTPGGKLIANVLAAVAQWEREMISDRTKSALAAKKAEGFTLGRPPMVLPPAVAMQVLDWDRAGHSLRQIAEALEDMGQLSPEGKVGWSVSTVSRILMSLRNGTKNVDNDDRT